MTAGRLARIELGWFLKEIRPVKRWLRIAIAALAILLAWMTMSVLFYDYIPVGPG